MAATCLHIVQPFLQVSRSPLRQLLQVVIALPLLGDLGSQLGVVVGVLGAKSWRQSEDAAQSSKYICERRRPGTPAGAKREDRHSPQRPNLSERGAHRVPGNLQRSTRQQLRSQLLVLALQGHSAKNVRARARGA